MVDMQQDARAAMYMMTREIRMAGYDPLNTGATIRTANVAQMAFDSDSDGTADGVINDTERFFYALNNDTDGDGLADGTPCDLERGSWDTPAGPVSKDMSTVALNIDALNFVYLDIDGNTLNDDGDGNVTTSLPEIRSVQITLVARSGDLVPALMRKRADRSTYTNQQGRVILPAPNDNFRRIRLTAAVKVRNLGL
jgi:type IV pilus assembly protein PilW